ncbi:uncharacterized protein [Periplaneta americana]|uniref:uncharacterized protein isoform X3 n=1 Tax=Periplaneta americana TaxID=6978 RepID=UPI0037E95303
MKCEENVDIKSFTVMKFEVEVDDGNGEKRNLFMMEENILEIDVNEIKVEPSEEIYDHVTDIKCEENDVPMMFSKSKPENEVGNFLEVNLNKIKVEHSDQSYDDVSSIKFEENGGPTSLSVLKLEVEDQSCNVECVKEETAGITIEENDALDQSVHPYCEESVRSQDVGMSEEPMQHSDIGTNTKTNENQTHEVCGCGENPSTQKEANILEQRDSLTEQLHINSVLQTDSEVCGKESNGSKCSKYSILRDKFFSLKSELKDRRLVVLALVNDGYSAREASRVTGVPISTGCRWTKLFRETSQVAKKHSKGRPRISTKEQDKALLSRVEDNPSQHAADLKVAASFPGSLQTIRNRRKEARVKGRYVAKKNC